MSDNMMEVECLECRKEFNTSRMKKLYEIVLCTHFGCKHSLDDDMDDDGGYFWFLVPYRGDKP